MPRKSEERAGEIYASMVDSHSDLTKNVRAVVLHPDYAGWRFYVTFSPAGVPVGFEIIAEQPAEPTLAAMYTRLKGTGPGHATDAPAITANLLRSIRLGEIQDAARAGVVRTAGLLQSSPELAEHWGRAFHDAPRPGRRGRDDRAYAEVAALYVKACSSGSRRPLADLAKRLGYSESRLRSILNAARSERRGLLTKAPRGRHGGELTPKALDLLQKG
jgi:hypothetical protein